MTEFLLPALRIIPYRKYDPDFNMAADEYLMSQPIPVIRFYGWKKSTLSFGKNGSGINEVNSEICRKYNVFGVKRLTGGKTVLHQQELTYSFAGPLKFCPKGLLATYFFIGEILQKTLRQIGVEASLKKEKSHSQSNSSICFREISSYELTLNGKKIIGNAQCRRREAVLQHGSILLDIDFKLWQAIWQQDPNDSSLAERVMALNDALPSPISAETLSQKISDVFKQNSQTPATLADFTPDEKKTINRLVTEYPNIL